MSGRELPRMEIINEPLVKIGPEDDSIHPKSPYFTKQSDLVAEVAQGRSLHDRFGLPIKSEAPVSGINEIRPKNPALVFISEVAPTSELYGRVAHSGGGTQYLVLNRDLFTQPVRVALIGNDLALHDELVVGRGRGVPVATLDDAIAPRIPGAVRGLAMGLGGAASAYGAVRTGQRMDTLLAQDNPLAASNAARDFAANNVSAWAAGVALARVGAQMGGARGPQGAVIGGIVGGVGGYMFSDAVMQRLDNRQIFQQTDRDGVDWQFNGRQWLRQQLADLAPDGVDAPRQQAFAALPDKASELDYRASNIAVAQAMGRLPPPRDPYTQAADANDSASQRPADWTRQSDSGQWQRTVVIGSYDRGQPLTRQDTASPERAAQLDQQATKTIRENIANGPAALAARYAPTYRREGWDAHGGMPQVVEWALSTSDTLMASNGKLYQRATDGAWTQSGRAAEGNLPQELDATRAVLQPALADYNQALAQIERRPPLTPAQQDLANLADRYAQAGINPRPETMEAVLQAVQQTRQTQGIDAATTALALGRSANGGFDVNSPIEHLREDRDGVVRVAAVTGSADIQRALQQVQASAEVPPFAQQVREAPAMSIMVGGPRFAGGAPTQGALIGEEERRRMIEDDRPHSNAIHVAARPDLTTPEMSNPVQTRGPRDPRDPDDPNHAMNQSVREQVKALYAEHGANPTEQQLDQLTAGVMRDAKRSGMDQVKLIEFSVDPRTQQPNLNGNLIAYSGDPDDLVRTRWSKTDTQQAQQTAPERAYQDMDQATQQRTQQQAQFEQQQRQINQNPDGPSMQR